MKICGCIISLLLLATSASSQDAAPVYDSTARRFIPTGVRIGTDLITLGKSQISQKFEGWEVSADMDVYRFYPTFEFGSWSVRDSLKNGLYTNNGTYYRVGVDVNFLLKDPERNMFFLGFRSGRASYTDFVQYTFTDDAFGTIQTVVTNPEVTAVWTEATAGLRVRVWKVLWLGATARFKFRVFMDGADSLRSYDVPGFGRTFKKSWWGINYQAFVRLPLRPRK